MLWILLIIVKGTVVGGGFYPSMDACVAAGMASTHAYICRLDEGEPV